MGEKVVLGQGGAVPIAEPCLCIPGPISNSLLNALSISHLFDMQAAVVAHLAAHPDRDAIICAPTGSGKTLSYALPILSRLHSRVVPKLRALVVVPTRDLAAQVHRIFKSLSAETSLVVSVADGSSSVKREALSLEHADILVATPGRLVEHTKNSPSFSLSNVQFLVLDESDRLLHDSFYSWVEVVVPECGRESPGINGGPEGLAGLAIHPIPSASGRLRRKPQIILASATQTTDPKRLTLLDLERPVQFVGSIGGKKEPRKSGGEPTLEEAEVDEDGEALRVPDSLVERAYVVDSAGSKPAALCQVLGLYNLVGGEQAKEIEPLPTSGSTLVFTKSVEAAHRLARLLEVMSFREKEPQLTVLEMSGELSRDRRASVLNAVRLSKAVIVCSDVLARGMDISGVDAVVNYDAPVHVTTYVHRVGRTARAGREGVSVSLVVANEARHFKALVRSVGRGDSKIRIRSVSFADKLFNGVVQDVQRGLAGLKRVLRREQLGLITTGLPLPSHVLRDLKRATSSFAVYQECVEPENIDDEVDPGEDDFSHLVRAQIARNFLSQRSQ